MDLTTLARWTIRPRLMAIPGVANVAIWGQRDRQFQVLVDPDRLRGHGVTLDDVDARRRATPSLSAPAASSTRPTSGSPCTHRARGRAPRRPGAQSRSRSATARRSRSATSPTCVEGFPPPIGDAVINDGPGLLLIVEKQPCGNTLDVTRDVEAALDALGRA